MIRKFGLKNFKPFASTELIPFAPITLIYGPNSGGKTSLIQSLRLLKQTLSIDGADVLNPRGKYVDLGSYKSLIHRHETERDLSFSVVFDARRVRRGFIGSRAPHDCERKVDIRFRHSAENQADNTGLHDIRFTLSNTDRVILDISLVRKRADAIDEEVAEPDLEIMDGEFAMYDVDSIQSLAEYFAEREQRQFDIRNVRLNRRGNEFESADELRKIDVKEFVDLLSGVRIASRSGLPARIQLPGDREQRRRFNSFQYDVLTPISTEFIDLFQSTSHLGPLRSHPARHYVTLSNIHDSVGQQGEFTPQVLHQRSEICGAINEWFLQFEIPYVLEIQALGNEVTGTIISLVLTDSRLNVPVAPSDVGFGIGQLLPVLVEGCIASEQIICVEQPEIHLHPRLQAHLADFFIKTSAVRGNNWRSTDPGKGNQWIVETHSETLIRRLQRRIREGVLSNNDVSVLYVEPGVGGSQVLQLRLDEVGDFVDEWPGGFFDDGFKEAIGGI